MTSLSTATSGVGIGPNMGADGHNLMQNQTQFHGASQVKRVKQTKAQTQALSQSVVTNMSANLSNFNGSQNQPSNNQYASRGSNTGKEIFSQNSDKSLTLLKQQIFNIFYFSISLSIKNICTRQLTCFP